MEFLVLQKQCISKTFIDFKQSLFFFWIVEHTILITHMASFTGKRNPGIAVIHWREGLMQAFLDPL